MRLARIAVMLLGALVGVKGFGANFTLVAVGGFGEPLTECRVESFRPSGTGAKHASDYKERFRGLVASDVPDGKYGADISCRGVRIGRYVSVSNPTGSRWSVRTGGL
jgi:hypothetical protein